MHDTVFHKVQKFGQFSCGKVWSEYVSSPFSMYSMNLRIIWNNCLIVSPQITCHKRYNTTYENERCTDKKSFTNIKPCSTSHVILMWWIWACTVFPHHWISKSFRWCWKGWTWTFFSILKGVNKNSIDKMYQWIYINNKWEISTSYSKLLKLKVSNSNSYYIHLIDIH